MLRKFRLLLRFIVLIVLCGPLVSLALPSAQAQLIPGSGTSKSEEAAPDGMESLLEEARKDGSTVIIVRPGDDPAEASADQAASRADLFYKARTRLEEIVASVPTLWPNIRETLKLASPDGSYFWIIRAVGTAFLGLLFGQLARRSHPLWPSRSF